DLQRQRKLRDVDVVIDITLTLRNVSGKVIVFLHLNGSTVRLSNCTSQHFLMFLVICAVLKAKLEHGFADFRLTQFAGREAISPNAPMLEEKGSVQDLNVVEFVCVRHALEPIHCLIPPSAETRRYR